MVSTPELTALAATVLVGLFAGVLFTAFLAISPSLALLDGPNFTKVKQAQIRKFQNSMTAVSSVYLILSGWLAYYGFNNNLDAIGKGSLLAFGLVLLTLVYSAFTDIPLNIQILKWTDPIPTGWEKIRSDWDKANNIRMVPTLAAFIVQAYVLTLF